MLVHCRHHALVDPNLQTSMSLRGSFSIRHIPPHIHAQNQPYAASCSLPPHQGMPSGSVSPRSEDHVPLRQQRARCPAWQRLFVCMIRPQVLQFASMPYLAIQRPRQPCRATSRRGRERMLLQPRFGACRSEAGRGVSYNFPIPETTFLQQYRICSTVRSDSCLLARVLAVLNSRARKLCGPRKIQSKGIPEAGPIGLSFCTRKPRES